ncbi:MAG: DUF1592 domain-containing protein, partial [Akkermansiaceae bacterium]|nr:DUF1592 domain-containing protein [Akkermansiaceae bacterium]
EYEHTVHDLLGVDLPLVDRLPADENESGFETVADYQQLSHFHLDKYLAAADAALDEALGRATRGDRTFRKFYGPKELTSNRGGGNYRGPEARGGKVITWPVRIQFFGRMPATRVPASGWYRITLKNLRAINPGKDGTVWGSLQSGGGLSADPVLHYIASVEGTAKARDHVHEAWIQEGHLLVFKPTESGNRIAPSGAGGGNVSFKGRDLARQGFAGLEFDGIELRRIHPNATRAELQKKLLPGVAFKDGKPVIANPRRELDRLVKAFASRAFRRPVTDAQAAPYQALAAETFAETGKLPEALRTGYRAILCSPRFLTFVEAPGKLDDHALATRLSYLFWDSMPDWTLRDLANRGELRKPEVFRQQVDRLLDDDRARRFIASFTDQWLNLKEIDFTSPDRRYRDFDPIVQDSMVQETRAFLAELIREDLGITNLVKSDFVMLNTRLKEFYRLADAGVVPGKGMQRVPVSGKGRSGLLTHGSILKVTADGAVTSPVVRGVWVAERILGMHIPPPPPNIPAVEPDIRGATSIRDQLDKHRSDSSCAACHAKIDPAGFALESFDPIGLWRTKYGNSRSSASVDPSGVTPDGEPFANFWQWREIYHRRPAVLAEAFTKQFLAYATGAPVRFSDREAIESILAAVKQEGYGLRSIIHAAVASDIFQYK